MALAGGLLIAQHCNVAKFDKLREMEHRTKTLVFISAFVGAFVAGLDAGLVYNSWPEFANNCIPSDILSHSPTWENFFDNPVTVQFMHRNLAYLTLLSVTTTWIVGRRMNYQLKDVRYIIDYYDGGAVDSMSKLLDVRPAVTDWQNMWDRMVVSYWRFKFETLGFTPKLPIPPTEEHH
uniref:Holocytochrome c-type synthase n=1 Tax=Panagrolaimus sp. PS1159 TaxID=55785 RepID=A0AC35F963_9BILA